MKFYSLLLLVLMARPVFAAQVDDVLILDTKSTQDGIELKLREKASPKDSYFYVNIVKEDKESFDKLGLVIKKLQKGRSFKLNLDIPSFSRSPSGSSYRSEYVTFSGSGGN
jgi:hypothetical protein